MLGLARNGSPALDIIAFFNISEKQDIKYHFCVISSASENIIPFIVVVRIIVIITIFLAY